MPQPPDHHVGVASSSGGYCRAAEPGNRENDRISVGATDFSRRTAVADPHPESSLDGLLQAIASGDKIAFGNLYGRTIQPVISLVRLLMRDVALAEEVTQDVFMTVWLSAGRFDSSRGRAGAWIMAIARSRAIDRIKSVQAARERDHRFATEPMPSSSCPDEEVLADLDRHRIHTALAVLTKIQRQAIMLAFFGGHSYSETAQLLGVPLATLKSRVREGLIRLRRHLDTERITEQRNGSAGER
jgi:RNA polymerase sigma-70 factor (ECF subfamily)